MKNEYERRVVYDSEGTSRLYSIVSRLGVVLVLVGMVLELETTGTIRTELWVPWELTGAARQMEPSVATTAGIWVLIFGPLLGVGGTFFRSARRGRRSALVLSGMVLGVVGLSVPIKFWLQGGL